MAVGTNEDDILEIELGDPNLDGLGGDDILIGSNASDNLFGRTGNDEIFGNWSLD